MDVNDFPSFDGTPDDWARMIGARLVHAMAKHGLVEQRDQWLAFAKPALKYETRKLNDDQIPIGATKLFGLPDLPPGTKWPRQKDCKVLYDPDSGIEPETLCGFVGQINLAELAGTHAGRLCCPKGLVSIFSCAEIASIEMVDGCVIYSPGVDNLVRTERPELPLDEDGFEVDDEANELIDAEVFTFTETLELPETDDESPFEEFQFGYGSEVSDKYDAMQKDAEFGELQTVLGYTRPTTGGDPLPGPDWCHFICVQNSIEMMLHFCIRNEDLAAGRFDSMKLAWVDFD